MDDDENNDPTISIIINNNFKKKKMNKTKDNNDINVLATVENDEIQQLHHNVDENTEPLGGMGRRRGENNNNSINNRMSMMNQFNQFNKNQKQNGGAAGARRDFVTSGYCFLQKSEAQRNVMKAVEDKMDLLSLLRNNEKITTKPSLIRTNAIRNVMNGYQFPERNNATRTLCSDSNHSHSSSAYEDGNSCDNSTSTLTTSDSESNSMADDIANNNKKHSTHHRNCKSFEEFVVKTVERQKRRYKRGIKKQNNTLLFTCTDKINHDYTKGWSQYEEDLKKKQKEQQQKSESNNEINTTTKINDVEIHLYASSCIFQQFLNVIGISHVADKVFTKPSDDTISHKSPLQVIYGDMEKYLLTQLSLILSDMKNITPRQAAQLINWYNNYLLQIQVNDKAKIIKPSSLWKNDIKKLLDRYLQCGVRNELHILLDRIDHDLDTSYYVGIDNNLRQTRDGMLVTSIPEEMVYIIDLQIQVANDYLCNIEYIIQVLQVCYEEISIFICNKMIQIESNWRSDNITISRYCSIINDSIRLNDLLEDYTTKFISKYKNEKSNNNSNNDITINMIGSSHHHTLLEKAMNVENELTDLSIHAMNYLCRFIVYRLETSEALLCSVGELSWESDDECYTTRSVVSYLRETFGDIEVWICNNEYFFPKIVKKCFQLIIQLYIETFYKTTMKHGIQGNSLQVSNILKQDYYHLATFYNTNTLFVDDNTNNNSTSSTRKNTSGLLLSNQDINAQLLVILSISRLLDPTVSPTDLSDDTRNVMECVEVATAATSSTTTTSTTTTTNNPIDNLIWIRICNATAVLHLIGLREKNDKSSSMKWIRNIVYAEQTIQESKAQADISLSISPSSSSASSSTTISSSSACSGDVKWMINLPDLLLSPYVFKIRYIPDNEILHSLSSSDTFMKIYIQMLKELLETKGYKKQFQMYMARKTTTASPLKPTTAENNKNKTTANINDDNNALNTSGGKYYSRSSIGEYMGGMFMKR